MFTMYDPSSAAAHVFHDNYWRVTDRAEDASIFRAHTNINAYLAGG